MSLVEILKELGELYRMRKLYMIEIEKIDKEITKLKRRQWEIEKDIPVKRIASTKREGIKYIDVDNLSKEDLLKVLSAVEKKLCQ